MIEPPRRKKTDTYLMSVTIRCSQRTAACFVFFSKMIVVVLVLLMMLQPFYQGCSRARSDPAGRVGPGRVVSSRVRVTPPDPTRPDQTRPDPREFENLVIRPDTTGPDPIREVSTTS